MTASLAPLVGSYFRPPAKVILSVLGTGTPLRLVPEPENPADPNAIAVFVETSHIPARADFELEVRLEGSGHTVESIRAADAWQLGYIRATIAAEWIVLLAGQECPATLLFGADGNPQVKVEQGAWPAGAA